MNWEQGSVSGSNGDIWTRALSTFDVSIGPVPFAGPIYGYLRHEFGAHRHRSLK